MGQCRHKRPSLTGDAWPHSTWRQSGKTRRQIDSEQQIDRLPGLLAVKMIQQQISLINRLAHQSTTPIYKCRQCRTRAEHCTLKSWPLRMRGLEINKNIPVSVTKLTLGLRVGWQRTNYSQLTQERSLVHRWWVSCLRPKSRLHW